MSNDGHKFPTLHDPQFGNGIQWCVLSENHFDFVSDKHIPHDILHIISQIAIWPLRKNLKVVKLVFILLIKLYCDYVLAVYYDQMM